SRTSSDSHHPSGSSMAMGGFLVAAVPLHASCPDAGWFLILITRGDPEETTSASCSTIIFVAGLIRAVILDCPAWAAPSRSSPPPWACALRQGPEEERVRRIGAGCRPLPSRNPTASAYLGHGPARPPFSLVP